MMPSAKPGAVANRKDELFRCLATRGSGVAKVIFDTTAPGVLFNFSWAAVNLRFTDFGSADQPKLAWNVI
jgi:hypothetical protein